MDNMTRLSLLSTPRSFVFTASGKEPVYGIRLRFRDINGNVSRGNVNGAPQYFMDVIDTGARQVMFIFSNREPGVSFISDIYFNDGKLITIAVHAMADPDIGEGDACSRIGADARQEHITDTYHDSTLFEFVRRIPVGTDSSAVHAGINYNETLGIVFDLQAGVALPDILNALGNTTLNIGIKVRGDLPSDSRTLINEHTLNLTPALNPRNISLAG